MSERMTAMEVAFATLAATLGTKLDALIVAVGTNHTDHETRVRTLETRPQVDPTHETRLVVLERAGVETHEQRIDALEKAVDETHGPRLTRMERWWYLMLGGAVAAGTGGGWLSAALQAAG